MEHLNVARGSLRELTHLNDRERIEITRHYAGVTTWEDIVNASAWEANTPTLLNVSEIMFMVDEAEHG